MNKLSQFIIRFRWLTIIILVGITVFLALQIPKIRIDNELTTFLPENDPAKQFYGDIEEIFGSQIMAVIGFCVEEGGPYKDIFHPAILTMIYDMSAEFEHTEIEAELAFREKVKQEDGSESWEVVKRERIAAPLDDVVSLATLSHVISKTVKSEFPDEEDEEVISVEDILPEPPGTKEERFTAIKNGAKSYKDLPPELLYSNEVANHARDAINSWDMYKNNIVGQNSKGTAIYLTIPRESTIEYETKLHAFIEKTVAKYDFPGDGLVFHIAGLPMVSVLIGQYMQTDLKVLVPICFLVMTIVLIISFRRLMGMLMPFITVAMAVVWTIGIMAFIGKAMTIITNGLPVLLVAVGSAYTIHVIHHFFEQAALGIPKKEAIVSTMQKIGIAVLMAGLTTVGGFGSLASSRVLPIKDFGMFAAIGAFVALTINFLLVPALLAVWPYRQKNRTNGTISAEEELRSAESSWLGRALRWWAQMVATNPKKIALISLLVALGFLGITTQVISNSDMVKYFRKNSPIRVSDEWLNATFGGTTTFSIVIDSKESEGFMKPENLRKVESLQNFMLDRFPDVIAKSMSITDYVKKINKTVGKDNPDQYRIPDTEAEVFDELLLYESKPEVLKSVIDFDRRNIRLLMRCKEGGTFYMDKMRPVIFDYVAEKMPEFDVKFSGEMYLRWITDKQIVEGQKRSIALSLVAVFILLIIIFRSLKLGLMCLIPIVISILGNFTIMVFSGFHLDVGTALIASTAVGIGIDYAIHYVNRYRIERQKTENLVDAVRITHVTTGKAIIFNAVTVALGFMVLMGSQFIPLIRMGMLTAAVMFFAGFSTLTTLPALLVLVRPYNHKKND